MFFTTACNNRSEFQSTYNDTTEIVRSIIDNNHLNNVLVKKPDTIFIIKSSNVTKDWPPKTNKFKLIYIERSKQDENLVDLSPQAWNDRRTRIDFGQFLLNKDTANVTIVLYEFHEFSIYDYELKYKNGKWIIIKVKKRNYLI